MKIFPFFLSLSFENSTPWPKLNILTLLVSIYQTGLLSTLSTLIPDGGLTRRDGGGRGSTESGPQYPED